MAMSIKTTIRNIALGYSDSDGWVDDGGEEGDFERLRDAEISGEVVTIISEETDGYFNIKLADGHVVDALSAHHLAGFINNDGEWQINYNALV